MTATQASGLVEHIPQEGGFPARKARITLEARNLAEADGIALTISKWVLKGTGPDGSWLFVIDNLA